MEEAQSLFQGRRITIVYPQTPSLPHTEIDTSCLRVLAYYPEGYNPETGAYRKDDLLKIITDPGGTRVVAVKHLFRQ